MYNELIDALQCASHFALYQDCYEKNCYANSGKGLYCNIPKLMADAADAIENLTNLLDLAKESNDGLRKELDDSDAEIERLQTENDELRARWSAATIEGFPVKDLMLFAQVCRKNRVAEHDLQTFAWNMEKALEIVRKEFDDSIQKSMNRVFQYGIAMNDACRKRNREEKPDDPIRPN